MLIFCVGHSLGKMEENETRINQFEQKLKKLCKIDVMVATTAIHGRNHDSKMEEDCAVNVRCSRNHGKHVFSNLQYNCDHNRNHERHLH